VYGSHVAAVEPHGLDAIAENERHGSPRDLFGLWFGANSETANFAVGILAVALYGTSLAGAIAGLVLGQLHVWWRHTCELGWTSPAWLVGVARLTGLVLPEDHNVHHQNPEIEFGDIFRFYDAPARHTIAWLRAVAPRRRSAAAMRRFRARDRRSAAALRALKQRKSPTG